VVRGSPGAQAGLEPGDYVYQIGGRDFAGEQEFADLAKTLRPPLRLLMEREGRLRTVEIPVQPESQKRAA
jgi:S1-C subfamily serine protease